MDLARIQQSLRAAKVSGWLFCDFHHRDMLSYRILGLDTSGMTTRRWFYYIPANGEPVKLAHRVEPRKLDPLPGRQEFFLSWRELHEKLKSILGAPGTIAMVDFDGGARHRADPITRDHVEAVLRRISGTDVAVTALRLATTWTDRAHQATAYRKGRVLLAGSAFFVRGLQRQLEK